MLSFLSFAVTFAIVALTMMFLTQTIRTSGEKIVLALSGVRPTADVVPLRRRPARLLSSAPQLQPRLRAAA